MNFLEAEAKLLQGFWVKAKGDDWFFHLHDGKICFAATGTFDLRKIYDPVNFYAFRHVKEWEIITPEEIREWSICELYELTPQNAHR